MRGLLCGLVLATVSVLPVWADDGENTSILDTFLAAKTARSPEISPDGKFVAFRTFENDFGADKDMAQLYVGPTDGSRQPLQLTFGDEPVSEFEWSADSSFIAFRRDSKLYFISVFGGEPKEQDLGIKGARGFQFAGDGSAVFFTAGAQHQDKIKAREKRYGKYEVVREDGTYRHLWRADLIGSMEMDDPEQLTFEREFSITGYAVSPDSKQIAFTTWPSPHLADLLDAKIYITTADGDAPRMLDDSYGSKSTPVWRADGGAIAYTNSVGFPNYGDVVINNLEGEATTIKMPDHDASLLRFDDSHIYFNAGVRTDYGLFRMDTNSDDIERLTAAGTYAFGQSFSRDGKTYASLDMKQKTLGEITVHQDGKARTLTQLSQQLEGLVLPEKELITWTNDVGQEIEGVLTKPVGFEAGKRYPLFVRTHGGPTGTDRPILGNAARSIYAPDVLAAEGGGALVLQTNYRGSASYGDAFQRSNLNNLGIGPAKDIIAGVNMLIKQGLVDPDRVACLGWSQGGHISAMLATYSDICTASIMGAGISDWRTYYYNTDITQFTTEYFSATPFANDEVYRKTSPVSYIHNATTPVLIQHGENDARVPIANGYQFRQLLLDKGVEARMIVYAGMGHGPSKPKHRRAITEHALAWFREHVFAGDEADFVFPVSHTSGAQKDSVPPE